MSWTEEGEACYEVRVQDGGSIFSGKGRKGKGRAGGRNIFWEGNEVRSEERRKEGKKAGNGELLQLVSYRIEGGMKEKKKKKGRTSF